MVQTVQKLWAPKVDSDFQWRVRYRKFKTWPRFLGVFLSCPVKLANSLWTAETSALLPNEVSSTWREEGREERLLGLVAESRDRVAVREIAFRPHEDVVLLRSLSKNDSVFRFRFPLKQGVEKSFMILQASDSSKKILSCRLTEKPIHRKWFWDWPKKLAKQDFLTFWSVTDCPIRTFPGSQINLL